MTVIEWTIFFENDALKSREYNIKRSKDVTYKLLQPVSKFKMLFLEITSLGFIGKQSYEPFESAGVNSDHTVFSCMETAIWASYFIFCRRKKSWTDQWLLNYM